MADLFVASRSKLKRARQFIKELESTLSDYMANDPVSARGDLERGAVRLDWKGTGDQPGTIVGDAIHNLRSALDLMASELARLRDKSDKDVYFPFSDSPDTFEDAIKRRRFDKAGEDAVALLRSFAPYRGGNEQLRAIHDLDIQDKHSALILTGRSMEVHVTGQYEAGKFAAGVFVATAEKVDFIFPEGGPFGGQNTVETLKELVELVDGILEAFARLVAARA